MSASTENLVIQIGLLEETIAAQERVGQDVSALKEDLKRYQRKLQAASEALNESKQVLKG
jgi:hypothetical protein